MRGAGAEDRPIGHGCFVKQANALWVFNQDKVAGGRVERGDDNRQRLVVEREPCQSQSRLKLVAEANALRYATVIAHIKVSLTLGRYLLDGVDELECGRPNLAWPEPSHPYRFFIGLEIERRVGPAPVKVPRHIERLFAEVDPGEFYDDDPQADNDRLSSLARPSYRLRAVLTIVGCRTAWAGG